MFGVKATILLCLELFWYYTSLEFMERKFGTVWAINYAMVCILITGLIAFGGN